MAIRLIATDLDGTLLDSRKEISEANLAALERARAAGVHLTIATGRMLNSAVYFGGRIGADVPLVCCNGGLVRKSVDEPPVFERCFEASLVRDILAFAFERGWYMQWYVGGEILARDYRPEYFNAYRTVPGFTVRGVGDDWRDYTERVLQLVVRDLSGERLDGMVAELADAFPGAFDFTANAGIIADLMPPGVTKALGVAALAEHLGLTADEVMCCGDADNDLSMLRWAGTSVVPASGEPAALALATHRAPSNDEDAIAWAVDRLVLAEKKA